MHDPAVEQEKDAQFAKDRAAFEALPEKRRRQAEAIADRSFRVRRAAVAGGKTLIGASEMIFNAVFKLPYVLIGKLAAVASNRLVASAKLGVGAAALAGRAALALDRGIITLRKTVLRGLAKARLIGPEALDRRLRALDARKGALHESSAAVIDWAQKTKTRIDDNWRGAKGRLKAAAIRTGEFLEYYGAIGLYRSTKWLLDPRTPSGKPLLGNEKANRAAELVAATLAFAGLVFEFSKLAVMAKIMHYKVAHSFFTDKTTPLARRLIRQAVFHPMITGGLTALKFVTLPAIAATRQVMKSTPFTQGIAYQYNRRLREHDALALKNDFEQAQAPDAAAEADPVKRSWREAAAHIKDKSFSFVGRFIEHIVEKSSPEFYEGRIKYYQAKIAARKQEKAGAQAGSTPIVVPQAPVPSPGADIEGPALGEAFGQAQKPEGRAAPEQPAAAQKPPPPPAPPQP